MNPDKTKLTPNLTSNHFPTIRRRLEQIESFGLPYKVLFKDREEIEVEKAKYIAGYLEGYIPEFVFNLSPFHKRVGLYFFTPSLYQTENTAIITEHKEITERLSKACGGIINSESFWFDEQRNMLNRDYLEVHMFDDPFTYLSHAFVLPSLAQVHEWKNR